MGRRSEQATLNPLIPGLHITPSNTVEQVYSASGAAHHGIRNTPPDKPSARKKMAEIDTRHDCCAGLFEQVTTERQAVSKYRKASAYRFWSNEIRLPDRHVQDVTPLRLGCNGSVPEFS